MKAMVMVKQVPDVTGKVVVNDDGTLNRAKMESIANPDDLNAVEAALRFKEDCGCKVVAFSMGPNQAEPMLRELLAMGVDEAVLISSREFAGSDTYGTSEILAAAIDTYGFEGDDIILCGQQAIDGDTAQVGPQLAERLQVPQATGAVEISREGNRITVKRLLDDGTETIRMETPCVVTCTRELNEVRYMTVRGTIECWDKTIRVMDYDGLKDHPLLDSETIGLTGSPTKISLSFAPPKKEAGRILQGSAREAAEELAGILTDRHII
ncbi:MAG: electron transfer flavoprotein subunit beta/FixA family protein [Mogibacterium sp.]|nr:electron transfer flavoprotein subunit beta/FixA family protein [Mogibacterium sp.]